MKRIIQIIWLPGLFLLLSLQWSSAQIITTIAGTGTGGYNGDGIPATTAWIYGPHGLTMDSTGNIYFAELAGCRIRKINIGTGLISTVAGTGTGGYNGDGIAATAAELYDPNGIVFDSNGDLIIADRGNHRIRKVTTATGMISTIAGTGTGGYNSDGILATSAQLNQPLEVSFDAGGNLYIGDWANHRIRMIDKSTGLISTVAGTGTGGYNSDGILATNAQLNYPIGVIFDPAGNFYIGDYFNQRIRKVNISTGIISTIAGTGVSGFNGDGIPATTAQLSQPGYIRFDDAGNMYIGDANNHRVRKIDAVTGLISTIAGTGVLGYNGDGINPTTAQLYWPICIYFDRNNCQLYIGDYGNQRVRKIAGGFTGCLPAVAKGNQVSCQPLPSITINNTNNNVFVPIYDSTGRIAAEINANGNNLGIVTTSLFTRTGPCREDLSHRLYLNRNITITPQNQPSGNVTVKLYILKSELDSLRNCLNSQGQPSGVASINEVDVFKNADSCASTGSITAYPLSATRGSYGTDYYLQVSISSFSSFYFANKLLTYILPVTIRSFTGKVNGTDNRLIWQVNCNSPLSFWIERSNDAIHFSSIGTVSTTVDNCNVPYTFTDLDPPAVNNYYRLRIIAPNGTITYTNIILLNKNNNALNAISLLSNPVQGQMINLNIYSGADQTIRLLLTDAAGRILIDQPVSIQPGNNSYSLPIPSLPPGIYFLHGTGTAGKTNTERVIVQ